MAVIKITWLQILARTNNRLLDPVCSNVTPSLCAKDYGIAREEGQTLEVAREECVARSCAFVKNSDSRQRITHFSRIL